MLNQPTSSPMITRIFGLLCCCCADTGALTDTKTTNDANAPSQRVLVMLIIAPSVFDYLGWAHSAPKGNSCAMQIRRMRHSGQVAKNTKNLLAQFSHSVRSDSRNR